MSTTAATKIPSELEAPDCASPTGASPVEVPHLSDMQSAIDAFAQASRKVEDYYRFLGGEVHRLSDDLEKKNQELENRIVEKERMQAMLFSTLQSLTCGVLAIGCDGIVVAANPAACEIFGSTVQLIAGRRIEAVLPEIDESDLLIHSLRSGAAPSTTIEWIHEANGHEHRHVKLTAVRASSPYDEHLVGLILAEDVSELRRLERRSAVQSRLAGMGELATNLAHEIRNPLGSISLFATSLAHELKDQPSLAALANHLVSGVGALEHVVSNTLEFARPRRMSMCRVNLKEVLAEALTFVEHPRDQKGVRIDRNFEVGAGDSEPEEASIAGDGEQLRQVFLNILLNALQAVDEGGRLWVRLDRLDAGRWAVEIEDNGVGIPADQIGRIFDPFHTTKEKGSGIGLAVVHRILCAHGAQIEVESTVGCGSTFRMIFEPEGF